MALRRVLCIQYPIYFQNSKAKAVINSGSKVNVMIPAYIAKLGIIIQKNIVGAQKINDLLSEIYSMASTVFSLQNSLETVWFSEETFLLADISMEVVLGIFFLSLSNINVKFAKSGKFT